VEQSTVFGLIGPSESGKRTLLNILAGREKPTPSEAPIGVESRHVSLCKPENSRKWYQRFGRRSDHKSNAIDGLEATLKKAQDILLLDDPLFGIDREVRDKYLIRIKRLAAEKQLTVIYATTDFETAAMVSARAAVLADSYIHQTGTPQELYECPISTIVARATGRCNIFSARRLTSTKFDIPEFQTIDGEHRIFAERSDIAKLGAINRNVSLAIRPENISMSFGASFPEDNLLKAIVRRVEFLGPFTQVELDANGLVLNATVFRLVGLGVGQECMIGLPPDRIKVLKD
jgi:ABC-type Fe3+/spermidine/putrescine transport system ATPase subunit